MMIDTKMGGMSNLVGSTAIDLSPLRREVLLPLQESTAGFQRGVFPLRDLMGNAVGTVSLVLRISCMGSALLPHLRAVPMMNREKEELVRAHASNPESGDDSTLSTHSLRAVPSYLAHLDPMPRDDTATTWRAQEKRRADRARERELAEQAREEAEADQAPRAATPAQHPAAALHELDQYAFHTEAAYDPAIVDPSALGSHAPQLSLGLAPPATRGFTAVSVPQLNAALEAELVHHNLRLVDQSDPYASKRIIDDVYAHPHIHPQADDYAPPALFFFKADAETEALQQNLLQVEYRRVVEQVREKRAREEQHQERMRFMKQESTQGPYEEQPQLDFHARDEQQRQQAQEKRRREEDEQRRREEEEAKLAHGDEEEVHVRLEQAQSPPRDDLQRETLSSPRARPPAYRAEPPTTTPRRHQTRHKASPSPSRRRMSTLERRFRDMEATIAEENAAAERQARRATGNKTAVPAKKIPSLKPPRLSVEERGRIKRREAEEHVYPSSGMRFALPAKSGSFPPPPLPAHGAGLPAEYGPLKPRPTSSTKNRPRPRSAVASAPPTVPLSAAFQHLQLAHEALQPSPQSSLHRRRVQFEPEAHVPDPPSPDEEPTFQPAPFAAFVSPTRDTATPAEFDELLREVDAKVAARSHLLYTARRDAPLSEFVSPRQARVDAAWPAPYAPRVEIGGAFPVTESQLAGVALDFLNDPNSQGAMSQYLLQQQLLGIHSMLQQPHEAIQQSISSMTAASAHASHVGHAHHLPLTKEPFQWEENLQF